jgi:hypothetical protein
MSGRRKPAGENRIAHSGDLIMYGEGLTEEVSCEGAFLQSR